MCWADAADFKPGLQGNILIQGPEMGSAFQYGLVGGFWKGPLMRPGWE